MRVAVLGESPGAYATAADLSLAGHHLSLWCRHDENLAPIRAAGGISLVAEGRTGLARFDRLTADLAEAVAEADVVIVSLPAPAHEEVARQLAERLSPRQIVLLTPGTFGSYVMAREIERAGGRQPFAFAETGTFAYRARQAGPAEVSASVRAAQLPTGVFPAARSTEVLRRLEDLFPSVRACRDALDAALANAGTVMHSALVLLNIAAIDGEPADTHTVRMTPSGRRLIDVADAERVEIRRRLGYPGPHYEQAMYDGTFTIEHRYVTEDISLGLPLLESAGRLANVETAVVSGFLALFGALLGRDLRAEGRGLDRLGLGELTLREIRSLLQDGWFSPMWRRVLDGRR